MLNRGIFATAAGAVWGILSVLPYLASQLGPIRGVFIWVTLPAWLTLVLPNQIPAIHLWLEQNWLAANLLVPFSVILSPILGIIIVYGITSIIQKLYHLVF